jgi:predicted molibdopterin-dependent oxidoreductase YjgC
VAKLTIDGREIEAPDGAPLVEVIKQSGIYIPNLCYIDGLPPYAGCRTCLVEIEGARDLQTSCTTRVTDGMVVRTNTPEAREGRKTVVSIILANHSDRCLTCHRVVKCKPGDTCLRDNVVTHRCVTCSKNYRCELQTTCELVEMAGYEPFIGEERSYYQTVQPEPDRGNPFFEFDPQMCIICTRCVRACDEIRHTGAISLAGRGYETRIAFGAGGPIHESNCDFCGACIDLCPVAALMEHPNKWSATQTERWVPTTCTYCSVGCSIQLGTKSGRGIIARPDKQGNPLSRDQICVRGRFHYDAIKPSERLGQPLVRRNGSLESTTWEEALELTVTRLARIRERHGPRAIGFLGSPLTTNEENYLLQKVARAVAGSNNVDSSAGPVARAVAEALRRAFGSEVLPADMTRLARSKTIVAIADDLESSHNVACLRLKDAVVREGARLVVVSPRWGELCDFAQVWLRPRPGQEAATVAALAHALLSDSEVRRDVEEARVHGLLEAISAPPPLPEEVKGTLPRALDVLKEAAKDGSQQPISIVYAVPHFGAVEAGTVAAAAANLTIVSCGAAAPSSLFVLPQEANVWGMRDMGVSPDLLPGYRPIGDEDWRQAIEQRWGTSLPDHLGLDFNQMLRAAQEGRLRALVSLGDNPLMLAPDRGFVQEALGKLELSVVIDALATDTAQMAHMVLPDAGIFGKEGTITSADRRVLRLHTATAPQGEALPAWRILGELGSRLAQHLGTGELHLRYASPAEIMEEMASLMPLYHRAGYRDLDNGSQQPLAGLGPSHLALQAVKVGAPASSDGFLLTTGRSLFTSYDGAATHSPEADKLHREECVEMNPIDAAALSLSEGDSLVLRNQRGELAIRCHITEALPPGTLFVPLYHDGGAVARLFASDGAHLTAALLTSHGCATLQMSVGSCLATKVSNW